MAWKDTVLNNKWGLRSQKREKNSRWETGFKSVYYGRLVESLMRVFVPEISIPKKWRLITETIKTTDILPVWQSEINLYSLHISYFLQNCKKGKPSKKVCPYWTTISQILNPLSRCWIHSETVEKVQKWRFRPFGI